MRVLPLVDRMLWATWEAGGAKIALSDGVVFRSNHVHDNIGPGLWCDIGCRNVVYDGNLVENNQDIGIFHEISFKAVPRVTGSGQTTSTASNITGGKSPRC
jgi:hypothetical protein